MPRLLINTLAAALLSAGLLAALPARADDLIPYLHAPTENSTWISWKSSKNRNAPARVEYGLNPKQLDQVAVGTLEDLSQSPEIVRQCSKPSGTYYYNRVKLSGLKPATPYYYRVVSGDEKSPVFRMRSQPEAGAARGHFRVLVIGDHQFTSNTSRDYEALLALARAKVQELYGGRFEDQINLMLNLGDQVDNGVLCQYEDIHFKQARSVISNIPTITAVGNHEYYDDPELKLYNAHFKSYEDVPYQGLLSKRPVAEAAFQVGNVLFVQADSNKASAAQRDWLGRITEAARNDPGIAWVIGTTHHPIVSEQYPSDGSAFVRDSVAPTLAASDKLALYLSAHSNGIYARGALRDQPVHHLISGGAAWGQFWGDTASQTDYEDVQKTLEAQTFQIIDIDQERRTMTVQTWSIGNERSRAQAGLVDRFVRRLDGQAPRQPAVTELAERITLPHSVGSSEFSGEDRFNSIEYQIAREPDFAEVLRSVKRDHENVFLSSGSPLYRPIDQNAGSDVTRWTLGVDDLFADTRYYIRVRHRDQNLLWSPWSEPQSFVSSNGRAPLPFQPLAYLPLRSDLADVMGNFSSLGCGAQLKSEDGGFLDTTAGLLLLNRGASNAACNKAGNMAELGLPGTELTVSAWVRFDAFTRWGGLIGAFQDNGSYERGWLLGYENQLATLALTSGTAMSYFSPPAGSLRAGEWVHMAGVYNGSLMRLYLNGRLVGSSSDRKGLIPYPPSGWLQLGAYKDDNEHFAHKGGLREAAIWGRALLASEIAELAKGTPANALPR